MPDGPTEVRPADAAAPIGQPPGLLTEKIGLLIDGRYRVIELIGSGGMGSVYKAEHVGIGRTVALKVLHPSLAQNPEVAKRFEREAAAVGKLEHPNCVDVSDFGRIDDGSLFLVMEYLQGKPLGDVLADETRLPVDRALRITRHVVRGLGHAHRAGIVHRDIKPENVLLCPRAGDPDFAKILDFGIAKLLDQQPDEGVKLTQAGVAFGTPIYMSPEQAVGNPVDGRADLYGATVVLHEMITGRPPFYSDDRLEVLSMHTSRPPAPFAESAPELEVPPQVEALVMRGLAKRPAERFADADEMIAAIDAVLADLPGAPPPPRVAQALPRRHQTAPVIYGLGSGPQPLVAEDATAGRRLPRRRLLLGLATALVATLAVIVVVLLARSDRQRAPRQPPAPAAGVTDVAALADRAIAEIRAGRPDAAIALLEGDRATGTDGAGQLALGHAYAAAGRARDALAAYGRALELAPGLSGDRELAANLTVMLHGKNAELAVDAADLLVGKLAADEAAQRLATIASQGPSIELRHRALALAEKHGLGDRADRVLSFALDLEQGPRCVDRLKAVARLRALGERRAIPHLQKARFRRSRTPKWRGMNVNACLKEDAEAAIAFLESEGR